MMKKRILFVCLGNICRSPAAEGILREMATHGSLAGQLEIDSAGTYGGHAGELPDPRMREAAARRGYRLESRSRRVTEDDFDRFDMLIAMDDPVYERLYRLAPTREAGARIFRMTDFCLTRQADHIPDPYYEGMHGFERVLDLLEDCCRGLARELTENTQTP
ncbi:phosphotyrosine protein phosphatase [Bacteroidia bacterium]|nr:phosphotyrosine protein phosphatase [Bacteroidia bacterium]